MAETQVQLNNYYHINDNHLINQDGDGENYSNLMFNDKENDLFDKKNYNKSKRIKDIKLCVEFDNYFANLASILKFSVEADGAENSNLGIILSKIEKDLVYLQENYTIVKRKQKEKYSPFNLF